MHKKFRLFLSFFFALKVKFQGYSSLSFVR